MLVYGHGIWQNASQRCFQEKIRTAPNEERIVKKEENKQKGCRQGCHPLI
jgi:hypothetical protein